MDELGTIRLADFDAGNQANSGANALLLGNVANSLPCEIVDGEIVAGHLLELEPATHPLTWLLQVMPIFFASASPAAIRSSNTLRS